MDASLSNLNPLIPGVTPLHAKAEAALRDLIAGQPYCAGALLPNEITLARKLAISRGTMRTALLRLVAAGVLERKAGIGTRVLQRPAESAVGAWRSLSREMKAQGIVVQLFRCELTERAAPARVARALRIQPGTVVQRLDRVRGWQDKPVLRSRSWFHPRVRFQAGEEFLRPLYDLIEQYAGIAAHRATEAFLAEEASAALARDLRVRVGSPLLLRRHTVHDEVGRPFEAADIHYVSRRFALTLDLTRGTR